MKILWAILFTAYLILSLAVSYCVLIPKSEIVGYHFEINGVTYAVVCVGINKQVMRK